MKFKGIILLLVLFGTILRMVYGFKFQLWNLSPDQIASELILQDLYINGDWNYSKLIHYPHEGGSMVYNLLALLLKPITELKSLVFVAFFLDTLSRFIQVFSIYKVFGRKPALLFGVWTIVSIPLIIPWTGLSFGLHSVSSCFPFLLLLFIHRNHDTRMAYSIDALFLALAIWFSYSNIVLVPVYVAFLFFTKPEFKYLLKAIIPFSGILLLHGLVRLYADAGFQITEFSISNIRGESFDFFNLESYGQITTVWKDLMPNAMLFPELFGIEKSTVGLIIYTLLLIGILIGVYQAMKSHLTKELIYGIGIVVFYTVIYALSPFYFDEPLWSNYINVRHFTYILPLFISLSLVGYSSMIYESRKGVRLGVAGAAVFILVCTVSLYQSYSKTPPNGLLIKPTGWVLVTKFGHDPAYLEQLCELKPDHKEELLLGYGWGLGTNLFSSINYSETTANIVNDRFENLTKLINGFSPENRTTVLEGVKYAFGDEVTPKLDQRIYNEKLKSLRLK